MAIEENIEEKYSMTESCQRGQLKKPLFSYLISSAPGVKEALKWRRRLAGACGGVSEEGGIGKRLAA
jgi:hypothetical protein